MPGFFQPKGGSTQQTTSVQQVPQYASAAQQNYLDSANTMLSPWLQSPNAFTTAPVNADQSGAYDLARQLAGNAFSSMATPASTTINPALSFNGAAYLAANPDVAASSYASDPYAHYQQYGAKEGRAATMSNGQAFDAAGYLAANPDVAASGMDPLSHYLTFGGKEGRSVGNYAGTTYTPEQAAKNPVAQVSMQSLYDLARPTFVDPRNDPSIKAPSTANTYTAATYDPTTYNAATYNADTVSGADIQALLSPYTTSVVDTTNAIARRNLEESLASTRAQQAAAGTFGGSRGAIAEGVMQRGFQDTVAATTAQLMNAGWSQAQAAALANSAAKNTAGQFNANSQNTAGQFNANAANTAGQFNANSQNTAGQFNANSQNTRDTFNATQSSNALDAWNKYLQQDYTNAYGARQQDNTNAISAATTNESLKNSDFTRQQQALATLLGVGSQQRDIYQQNLDKPYQLLQLLAQGTPNQYGGVTTGTAPNNNPSMFQTLAGGAMTLLGTPLTGAGGAQTLLGKLF